MRVKPLRILVVDDDASIGAVLAEMLADMGHVVCGVEATETGAVKAALRDRPDLVIIDVHLREGSGVAAMAKIRQTAAIPHIYMSGGRLPLGPDREAKLQKPFMQQDLIRSIERACASARIDRP